MKNSFLKYAYARTKGYVIWNLLDGTELLYDKGIWFHILYVDGLEYKAKLTRKRVKECVELIDVMDAILDFEDITTEVIIEDLNDCDVICDDEEEEGLVWREGIDY